MAVVVSPAVFTGFAAISTSSEVMFMLGR